MNDTSSRLFQETPNAIAQRLIQKAHNRDGLPEMVVGLLFLMTAMGNWVEMASRPRSIPFIAAILGMAVLLPILMLGSPWAIRWLRRRYLVERAGYVEFKPVNWKRFFIVFAIAYAVAFAGGFVLSSTPPPPDSWFLAATGVFSGALMAFAGRLPRYFVGGAIMAAAGIALAVGRVPLLKGFTVLFGLTGVLSLVSGCIVLLVFLRRPAEPGE